MTDYIYVWYNLTIEWNETTQSQHFIKSHVLLFLKIRLSKLIFGIDSVMV